MGKAPLPPWPEQDPYLREHYGELPVKELAGRLGRSVNAVRSRASRLGLIKHQRWTDEEKEVLRQLYGRIPVEELAKRVGHTVASVRDHASREGVTADYHVWTDQEDEHLELNYGRVRASEIGAFLGLEPHQVWERAKRLGLRRNRTLAAEAQELLWEMREMENAVDFFSQEFGVAKPALRRLLEEMKAAGGPMETIDEPEGAGSL